MVCMKSRRGGLSSLERQRVHGHVKPVWVDVEDGVAIVEVGAGEVGDGGALVVGDDGALSVDKTESFRLCL